MDSPAEGIGLWSFILAELIEVAAAEEQSPGSMSKEDRRLWLGLQRELVKRRMRHQEARQAVAADRLARILEGVYDELPGVDSETSMAESRHKIEARCSAVGFEFLDPSIINNVNLSKIEITRLDGAVAASVETAAPLFGIAPRTLFKYRTGKSRSSQAWLHRAPMTVLQRLRYVLSFLGGIPISAPPSQTRAWSQQR